MLFDVLYFCVVAKQFRQSLRKKSSKRRSSFQVDQTNKVKRQRTDFFQFECSWPFHVFSFCDNKILLSGFDCNLLLNNPNVMSLVDQTQIFAKKQPVHVISEPIQVITEFPLISQIEKNESTKLETQQSIQSKSTHYLSFNFIVPTQCAELEMTQILEDEEQEHEGQYIEPQNVAHVSIFLV